MDSYDMPSQPNRSAVPLDSPPSYSHVYKSEKYAEESDIPFVSPVNEHYHLTVLRYFCALYNIVEASFEAESPDDKARNLELFLACAEARYLSYLLLLEEYIKRLPVGRTMTLPLPPWDVAIVFHAHCLSPFRFFADMLCRGSPPTVLWDSDVVFPLERLHYLIVNRIWSNPESEKIWNEAYPNTPYQLWNMDPTVTPGTILKFQEMEMFTLMHCRKNVVCICASCERKFDVDSLSAQILRQDLLRFLRAQAGWHVKGVALDGDGNQRGMELETDLSTILQEGPIALRRVHRGKSLITGTTLVNYIKSTDDVTWKGFFHAFRETLSELKAAQKFKDINKRNIFARLRSAYMGLLWRDLSIDLVAASLRQREFAKKITGDECIGIDSPDALNRATDRYHRFLLLLQKLENPAHKVRPHLVPTLDIDLCWHTHQLFPNAYRQWCFQHLGRGINHDDTIGKAGLKDGLRHTSLAWFEAYNEPYTTDDLKKEYVTTGRKVAGVRFPLYGLHVSNKAKKLGQAQTDHHHNSERSTDEYHPDRHYYMHMYPYWTIYPYGWDYPGACASLGYAGGWGPGVCGSREMANAEGAACGSGQCGGGQSACAGGSGGGGNCGAGNCASNCGGSGCGSGCGGGGGCSSCGT